MYLNYRNLPYRTEWISYPDIKPTFMKLGFEPTDKEWDGSDQYTCPAIIDPTTPEPTLVADSAKIAAYLEKAYPDSLEHPTLFPADLGSKIQERIDQMNSTLTMPLIFMMLPSVPDNLVDPRGKEYFLFTREKRRGYPLSEMLPAGSAARKENWERIKEALDALDAVFEGDLLFGDRVTYADIVLAALLSFTIDVPDGRDGPDVEYLWQLIAPLNGGRWARFMEKMEKYRA